MIKADFDTVAGTWIGPPGTEPQASGPGWDIYSAQTAQVRQALSVLVNEVVYAEHPGVCVQPAKSVKEIGPDAYFYSPMNA